MIFPRYHQLEAVRSLVDQALREGVGNNYLIEHSAGSGKSNTIGWLTHRLASLHDEANARVFDSVIVITDRVVLDKQLQDTIYQFEHKHGVVQKIDEDSRQLAEGKRLRHQIAGGILRRSHGRQADASMLVFASDYSFTSASAAAATVIGASANGRILWKLADGRCYADWEAEGTLTQGEPGANG